MSALAGALVDLWHADSKGDYDNKGFRLRGHVFTDDQGRFVFRAIMPGLYPGRTRHYHVKIQAAGQK
jgi:protocatechuate 3,4-dioxygenase beta subunit